MPSGVMESEMGSEPGVAISSARPRTCWANCLAYASVVIGLSMAGLAPGPLGELTFSPFSCSCCDCRSSVSYKLCGGSRN